MLRLVKLLARFGRCSRSWHKAVKAAVMRLSESSEPGRTAMSVVQTHLRETVLLFVYLFPVHGADEETCLRRLGDASPEVISRPLTHHTECIQLLLQAIRVRRMCRFVCPRSSLALTRKPRLPVRCGRHGFSLVSLFPLIPAPERHPETPGAAPRFII